jgi:hypothetical protein
MLDLTTVVVVSLAVFAGAFVSGLAGFAFSAVAGAVLLHIFPAQEAVPLMMVCSVVIQAINLWGLRQSIHWSGSIPLIVGGFFGVQIAVYLLQTIDTHFLRLCFGALVALYAAYMLFRPGIAWASAGAADKYTAALIGCGGGLVGGLTAMPGAVPTIWCDIRGVSKEGQRGLVQPFIATMQVFAIALLLARAAKLLSQDCSRFGCQCSGNARWRDSGHCGLSACRRFRISENHTGDATFIRRRAGFCLNPRTRGFSDKSSITHQSPRCRDEASRST